MTRGYRNSQLSQIRLCRYAYRRTYLDGDEGLPSPSLDTGSAVHSALSEAVRRLVSGGALLDIHDIANRTVRGDHALYTDTIGMLTKFQEAIGEGTIEINPKAVIHLEDRLEMPLEIPGHGTVTFFGTPDLVETRPRKGCRIADHKTHWAPESFEEFEVDQQLPRYALLIAHHYPHIEHFELTKWFVRYRNKSHAREITREDLSRVEHDLIIDIQHAIEIEEAGDFDATGGSWCAICRHHASCPLIERFRTSGEDWLSVPDDDHATLMAGVTVAFDGANRRMKDQLKAYLGGDHPTGAVAIAGGEFGYGPVEKREIEVEKLRTVMEAAGAELPDKVLRVDLDALDWLCGRLPEDLVKAIEAATNRWQDTRCQFRRTPRAALAAKPVKEEGILT